MTNSQGKDAIEDVITKVMPFRPPIDRLREIFKYSEAKGLRRWHAHRKCWIPVNFNRPYKQVNVEGQAVYAHHVIWALANGRWPLHTIDHKDRDTSNNSPSNLREATRQQQVWNKRGFSKTGVRGVYEHRDNFLARIVCNGKKINLGVFSTIEAAAAARLEAEKKYYGEFAPSLHEKVFS